MSLETVIPFVVQHNSAIIQAIVAAILFLVAILAIRSFRAGANPQAAIRTSGVDVENLEATLKKLLDKAQSVPQGTGSADQSLLASEIEILRASLQEKQDQIEQLKMQPAPVGAPPAASGGLSDEEKVALEAQVRDLQAKLSEYEIISEDIADLSFYKDENTKLAKELEALKAGGAAPAVVTAPVPPIAPVAEALVTEDDMMAALSPVLGDVSPAVAAVETAAAETAADAASADEDLMKEFNEAVTEQGGTPILDESVAATLFDVDRMTVEASDLQKVAATAKEVSEADLATGLDAERLAREAASMETIKPEDQKLMGDFEDFMKKGGQE